MWRGWPWLAAAGAIASSALMVALWGAGLSVDRLYYGTDTRAQALLVGSFLGAVGPGAGSTFAIVPDRWVTTLRQRRWWSLPGLIGALFLVWAWHALVGQETFLYRGGFLLVAVAAGAVIVTCVTVPTSPLPRLCSLAPLVFIGRISYGLYLYHWPLFLVINHAHTGLDGPGLLAARLAATFALATVSFFALEEPVRRGRFFRSRTGLTSAAVATAVTASVVLLATVGPATPSIAGPAGRGLTTAERQSLSAAGAFGRHPISFAIVGDSVALTLGVGLAAESVGHYGVRGVRRGDARVRPRRRRGPAERHRRSAHSGMRRLEDVLAGRHRPATSRCGRAAHRSLGGERPPLAGPVGARRRTGLGRHLVAEIDQAVDVLSSDGARVVLFTMPFMNPPNEAADGSPFPENDPSRAPGLQPPVGPGCATAAGASSPWSTSTGCSTQAGHYQCRSGLHRAMERRHPHQLRRRRIAPACDSPPGRQLGDGGPHPVSVDRRTDDDPGTPRARSSATGRERVPALDGLRALALLIIMGYHFGLGWLRGGFFSLDIFYVLSGYLITGLLVGEYRRRGRIKLSAFWLRRARRLLPALVVVLVAVTVLVRFAEPAGLYPDFRMSALSALFYFSNWFQIAGSGNYFVATGAVSPLTHTWSLAVEEQFYLVWPLVVLAVMVLARSFARGLRALLLVSAAGALASAAEMALLYHPGADITRLYFGTDTHAQSILVGATMACAMTLVQMHRGNDGMAPVARSALARAALVVVGLSGLAGTLALTYRQIGTAAFDYRGGFFLSALSAAAIIIGAVCVPTGPIAWGLSLRPMVWIGTISYGAYLWHYPVYVYLDAARTGRAGLPLLAIRFAATLGLAAASYYLVERPVMYGTFWRSLRAAVPATALMVATVAVVVAGTVVPATAAVRVADSMPIAERQSLTAAGAFTTKPVRFLLLGDSVALTLGVGLQVGSVERFGVQVINRGDLGCDLDDLQAIADGNITSPVSACKDWRTFFASEVALNHPDVVGLLVGRWDITDHLDDGLIVHIGQPAWNAHLTAEINQVVDVLSARGAKVVVLTMPAIDPPQEAPNGSTYPENDPNRVTEFNDILADVARQHSRVVTVVDLHKLLDPGGHFRSVIDGVAVRWADGIHISKPGGEWLQPQILPTVAQLGLTARSATGRR